MSYEKDLIKVLRDIQKDLHVIAKYVRDPVIITDYQEREEDD